MDEKQEELERVIGVHCGVEELKSIVEGLTTLPALETDAPPHTKRSLTRAFRDVMDDCQTDQEKGTLFLRIIPLVPAAIYEKVADIIIKGHNFQEPARDALESTNLSDVSVLEEALKKSSLKREFRIEGKIGDDRHCINMISLEGQVSEATKKGYTEEEIVSAIKKAVTSPEVKTYLYSHRDISLNEAMDFLRSVVKERTSMELCQKLSLLQQSVNEEPAAFLLRAMELRQKCLLQSEKAGEIPYTPDMLQSIFLRTVRLGLSDDLVKSRVEAIIDRDDSIDDADLLQELNRISEEESERRSRARYSGGGGNSARNVNVNQMNAATPPFQTNAATPPYQTNAATGQRSANQQQQGGSRQQSASGDAVLYDTLNTLANNVNLLTKEVARLRDNANPPSGGNQVAASRGGRGGGRGGGVYRGSRANYACDNCKNAGTALSCSHCNKCGQEGHKYAECPEN